MNDDQYLLASAYADGDVTAAERAQAEADPEVMAEVAELQQLRVALRDVEPAAAATRAAAIAAAMGEFGRTATTAPQPVRPPSRRTLAWPRTLGLAAAAVAALAVGAVVVNQAGTSNDNDDMASVAETAIEHVEDDSARAVVPAATDSPELGDATTLSEIEAPAAPAGAAEAAGTHAPAATHAPASTVPGTLLAAGSMPVIDTPEQLAEAGLILRDAYDPGSGPPAAPDNDCSFIEAVTNPAADDNAEAAAVRADLPESAEHVALLDTRNYLDADGSTIAVFVAVDLESGQTYAIDAAECTLVAVGTAP